MPGPMHRVKLEFIRPGKPVENVVIESFNGRLRDERFNANVFVSLHDGRQKKRGESVTMSIGRMGPRGISLRGSFPNMRL